MPHALSRRELLFVLGGWSASVLSSGCSPSDGQPPPALPDVLELDLAAASRAVKSASISPVALTRACLDRIARFDRQLNSFITVTADRAIDEARRAEAEIAQGRWRGPLHGIPLALKDNVDTAGVKTTAASAVFANRIPTRDADVVRRLKAAGAILLGKLNMHEVALGTTSAISSAGPTRNPWDRQRIAGGSSGGSAAAVAAGFCFGAIGTDTGGSIRVPAACCGIVGLKPTHGLVSLDGTIPLSAAFDHVGPMARSVADAALIFAALTDHGVAKEFDPDKRPHISNLRVGLVRPEPPTCDSATETEIQEAVAAAVEVLRPMVALVQNEAALPNPDLGRLVEADAYANHASHLESTPGQYDPRTLKLLLEGRDVTPQDARQLRQRLETYRTAVHDVFSRVDLVVLPTIPQLPMPISDAKDPFALAACTFSFNLGGWPAISVPCGFSRSGLPIGLMIGGPRLSEPRILAVAHAYQQVTDWHRRRPPIA